MRRISAVTRSRSDGSSARGTADADDAGRSGDRVALRAVKPEHCNESSRISEE
jgi:hypothetical protein